MKEVKYIKIKMVKIIIFLVEYMFVFMKDGVIKDWFTDLILLIVIIILMIILTLMIIPIFFILFLF